MSEGNGVDEMGEALGIETPPVDSNVAASDPNITDVPRPAKKIGRPRKAPGEVSGTRKEDDTYDTDPALALACCEWLQVHAGIGRENPNSTFNVLDPTAGAGPFAKAADVVWPGSTIVATDIRGECAQHFAGGRIAFACIDGLMLPAGLIGKADLIVTNPPFKLADQLVRHFWASMRPGATLAFLLNITFLGSAERWDDSEDGEQAGLFQIAPLRYCTPIVPRPSFLMVDGKPASPKFEAALFVWTKPGGSNQEGDAADWYGYTIIPRDPVRWVKPKKPRGGG